MLLITHSQALGIPKHSSAGSTLPPSGVSECAENNKIFKCWEHSGPTIFLFLIHKYDYNWSEEPIIFRRNLLALQVRIRENLVSN